MAFPPAALCPMKRHQELKKKKEVNTFLSLLVSCINCRRDLREQPQKQAREKKKTALCLIAASQFEMYKNSTTLSSEVLCVGVIKCLCRHYFQSKPRQAMSHSLPSQLSSFTFLYSSGLFSKLFLSFLRFSAWRFKKASRFSTTRSMRESVDKVVPESTSL